MLLFEIVVGVFVALWLFERTKQWDAGRGAREEDRQLARERRQAARERRQADCVAGHIFGRPLPMWLRAKQFRTGPAAP
jgi:hypothetical protein